MNSTYQDRKAARSAAYKASMGVSQPRRVFHVYARGSLVTLPERFEKIAVGTFASRKEADAFVNAFGPSTNFGSKAMKALGHMLSHDEYLTLAPGFETYVTFDVVSEEASA